MNETNHIEKLKLSLFDKITYPFYRLKINIKDWICFIKASWKFRKILKGYTEAFDFVIPIMFFYESLFDLQKTLNLYKDLIEYNKESMLVLSQTLRSLRRLTNENHFKIAEWLIERQNKHTGDETFSYICEIEDRLITKDLTRVFNNPQVAKHLPYWWC